MSITVYTITELEPILRMKARAIRKLLADGDLLGRLVGRQWLITEDDLKAFLEGVEPMEEQQRRAKGEELAELRGKLKALQENHGNELLSAHK